MQYCQESLIRQSNHNVCKYQHLNNLIWSSPIDTEQPSHAEAFSIDNIAANNTLLSTLIEKPIVDPPNTEAYSVRLDNENENNFNMRCLMKINNTITEYLFDTCASQTVMRSQTFNEAS